MRYTDNYVSPMGNIVLAGDGTALTGLWFEGQKWFGAGLTDGAERAELPVFGQTKKWLDIYFGGGEPAFTPAVALRGSEFQIAVWNVLSAIPYGKTVTYGEIARNLTAVTGRKTSARAVGSAVGRNPVSIIVPCHRVLGADGSLTGYAGGVERKRELLRLEGVLL
ncbi:MAG: methylated-DNA--[protein]-cysteine S-methyltransferase [Christensenellales bacterium]|nr:methylated-DNA--[protein]-cysteine S-methyltransferase [Christensenellales bacterium]